MWPHFTHPLTIVTLIAAVDDAQHQQSPGFSRSVSVPAASELGHRYHTSAQYTPPQTPQPCTHHYAFQTFVPHINQRLHLLLVPHINQRLHTPSLTRYSRSLLNNSRKSSLLDVSDPSESQSNLLDQIFKFIGSKPEQAVRWDDIHSFSMAPFFCR